MLKKFTRIQNVGKFRNASATGDTTLGKFTVVYGPNGYGKTTLCTILRSLSDGRPELVIGRKTLGVDGSPGVEILMEGGGAVFNNGAWNLNLSDITVFDGTFVSENVFSGDVVEVGHKRNLYRVIIGRDGVDLAREEERLAGESRAQTTVVSNTRKAVERHVPDGMKFEQFLDLPNDPDIDAKIKAAEGEVATAQQADNIIKRPPLSPLPVPALPGGLADLLNTTLEDIQKGADELIADHVAKHKMQEDGQQWIAAGMEYDGEDTCPFCGQGLDGVALIDAYKTVFGEAYAALGTRVSAVSDDLESGFGDKTVGEINTSIERNSGAVEFWQQHCDIDPPALTPPDGYGDCLTAVQRAGMRLLKKKASALLEIIPIDEGFASADGKFSEMTGLIQAHNAAIEAANEHIARVKQAAAEADLDSARQRLSHLTAQKNRHTPNVTSDCATYSGAAAAKAALDQEKARVREALDAHTAGVVRPYETKINSYLDRFNAGFKIAETSHGYAGGHATSSYQLVINDTNVNLGGANSAPDEPSFNNTLSAGDRSTLALAFFLAHLDHDKDLKDRIVAFDDPFSSQDSFRRSRTVHEVVKKGNECRQVFVLSHDATFLKQVWEKCPNDQRKALQIADQRALGMKLLPLDMTEACKGRAANELDDLVTFQQTGAGKGHDIIKKMRVVLETFCRRTYPGSFDDNDNLGVIVGKIRDGGDQHPAQPHLEELELINDYSRNHHHGEKPADNAAVDAIDLNELNGYVTNTLRIVNAMPS